MTSILAHMKKIFNVVLAVGLLPLPQLSLKVHSRFNILWASAVEM